MSRSQLIVIVGPTGAGKTDLSVRIASHYGAPILSTDSRQIYRELPIGTAQPSFEQLHAVEHHFIAAHSNRRHCNCSKPSSGEVGGSSPSAGRDSTCGRCAKGWTICRRRTGRFAGS